MIAPFLKSIQHLGIYSPSKDFRIFLLRGLTVNTLSTSTSTLRQSSYWAHRRICHSSAQGSSLSWFLTSLATLLATFCSIINYPKMAWLKMLLSSLILWVTWLVASEKMMGFPVSMNGKRWVGFQKIWAPSNDLDLTQLLIVSMSLCYLLLVRFV